MIKVEWTGADWEITFPNNDRTWYSGDLTEMEACEKARDQWRSERDWEFPDPKWGTIKILWFLLFF